MKDWFDYQPILMKMSPHSSPQKSFGGIKVQTLETAEVKDTK